ncbi:MAG: hypothetical protein JOZ83_04355 [Silvibacterium sp.]|nr:hypothetical protein [Silvibacterium sp.]
MTALRLKSGFVIAITLAVSTAFADTLQLKNGSLIKGKFMGGTESEISFQVGSTLQKYNVADIVSLKFDSEGAADTAPPPASSSPAAGGPPSNPSSAAASLLPDDPGTVAHVEARPATVTVPAGTRISVRTIDTIDSTSSLPGDRFTASLAEPLSVDGNVVVPRDALVYGRLTQAKTSGTFAGRSQLRLELTGIVVNGKLMPIVTGEYDVNGKSRGASTAKRAVAGAALGAIIGAAADGGQGAAIGAGAGAGAGATSEVIVGSEQVKLPSETLIDFTLEQEVTIPNRPS